MRRVLALSVALAAALLVPAVARAQTSATLTGTSCPGSGCLTLDSTRYGSVYIQIDDPQAGTWTAAFETSSRGDTYKPLSGTTSDGTTSGTTTSASNVYIVPGGALIRVRLTSYTSGTPIVTLRGAPASPPANISASVSAGSNPAAAATGAAVPSQASYTGVNIGGNLVGLTGISAGTAKAGAVAIVDGSGNQITTFGGGTQYANGAVQASPTGTVSFGFDGANVRALSSDTSGRLNLNNIFGTISLPTGAATSAKQPALGTAGAASTDVLTVQGIASMTALKVDGSGVTQPVSAAALPLPAGAATAAKQPALGTAGTPSADVLSIQGVTSMTPLKVDGSGQTQPVSGTVTVQQGTAGNLKVDLSGTAANATAIKVDGSAVTQPVSAASLPLPALAATSTKQSDGSQKTQVVDGSGNVIGSTSNALNVAIVSGGGSGGTASSFGSTFPATGTAVGAKDSTGTNMAALNLDASGFLKVNVAAGGGAGGTSSSFGAAIPGTGTAAGASDGTNMQLPRVFDGDTGAGTQYVLGALLKKPASGGTVDFGTSSDPIRTDPTGTTTQPVSGTVTVQQATASNLKVDLSGTSANATAIKVDGSSSTQPVSGTLTVQQSTASFLKAQVAQLAGVSTTATLQSAATANGNGTLLSTDGMAAAVITVNCATCSGGTTVNFEVSEDGANFVALPSVKVGSNTLASSTSTSGVTVWQVPVAGFQSLRARISSYSAGTVTVTGHSVPMAPAIVPSMTVDSSGNAVTVSSDATSNTASLTTGPQVMANGSTATPSAIGADGRSVAPWADTVGRLHVTGDASMTAVKVDGSGVTQPVSLSGNQAVNLAQVAGATTATGHGTASGAIRVELPTDGTGVVTVQPGNTANTTPWLVRENDGTNAEILDACRTVTPTYTPINISTATTTRIIAPTSAKKTYICAMVLFAAGTDNVGIVEGTGGTCGTATAGVLGGTTAASGLQLVAQTGVNLGDGGASVMATAGTNVDFCLITSAAVQLSGHVKWVQR